MDRSIYELVQAANGDESVKGEKKKTEKDTKAKKDAAVHASNPLEKDDKTVPAPSSKDVIGSATLKDLAEEIAALVAEDADSAQLFGYYSVGRTRIQIVEFVGVYISPRT